MTFSKKVFIWYGVISVAIVGILLAIVLKQNVTIVRQSGQIVAITDTVHQYKTKDGKNAAYIQTIVGSRKELLDIARQKDSAIYQLLKANKHIVDISRLQVITKTDTTVKNDTVYLAAKADTSLDKKDSLLVINHIKDPWYTADIKTTQDSTQLKLVTINKFDFTHEYKPNGLFKPQSLIVKVINENPHSITTGLDSYQVAPPKSKATTGFIAGVVVTVIAVFLIKH